ncbi:unnamed protein product [Amoebophrya sp. A120]|nr:unnamed protein product [Amoebophrya sp. A120]|eukprot:GSA120T00019645001.1
MAHVVALLGRSSLVCPSSLRQFLGQPRGAPPCRLRAGRASWPGRGVSGPGNFVSKGHVEAKSKSLTRARRLASGAARAFFSFCLRSAAASGRACSAFLDSPTPVRGARPPATCACRTFQALPGRSAVLPNRTGRPRFPSPLSGVGAA